ncbi:hypothetical protein DPMN_190450 [Dreissena polymorpha]|uniref:Uncharacterized protein n=1 Tax=Dreissena polymorpha TaxID=45954 RepID=A0A9D4DUN8_DREPO|nr:hypothetical protein DPMN_190450 [Dreissena polymorpha]
MEMLFFLNGSSVKPRPIASNIAKNFSRTQKQFVVFSRQRGVLVLELRSLRSKGPRSALRSKELRSARDSSGLREMWSLRLKGTKRCERQQWSSRSKKCERQQWSSNIRSASDSSGLRKVRSIWASLT